jgi:hypothetical protein
MGQTSKLFCPILMTKKKVLEIGTWADLIKRFRVNSLTCYSKLDHFINVNNICIIVVKSSPYKKCE